MSLCLTECFTKILCVKSHLLSFNRRRVKVKPLVKEFALKHFDQFYGSVFKNWPSIRLGLLCPHSYCAVVNTFSNAEETCQMLEKLGAYNMKEKYCQKPILHDVFNECTVSGSDKLKEAEVNIETFVSENFVKEHELFYSVVEGENSVRLNTDFDDENSFVPPTKLKFRNKEESANYCDFFDSKNASLVVSVAKNHFVKYPESWKIYYFPRGKFREFPPPQRDETGLLTYYLMDGASILPALALDVQPNEIVGDLCASPGGKALTVLFGFQFGKLLCNDISHSRLNKLKTVLTSYLPHGHDWNKRILISNIDVCSWHHMEKFDKILLDVPCTNDRLSVTRDGNNIFKQERFQERMKLPQIQTEMLSSALQSLKVGGSLVYSTCTLSPIQNDGVVHMSLTKLHNESDMYFLVKDLTEVFRPLQEMFCFSDNCRYGQLVLPFLPLNYGPMYICKIYREK